MGKSPGERESGAAVNVPEFQMACEQDPLESRYVVTLAGEIDIATIPALREFVAALDGDVVVNCEGVTFIDSAGLGFFLSLHRDRQARGHHVALRRLSGNCYQLFELTGLTGYLDVEAAEPLS
jgi:anti-sigma B factor antagonist